MLKTISVIISLLAAAHAAPQHQNNITFEPNGRIVGGKDIDIAEVPWQISMEQYGSHFCGGSIISANYIVTAAHCTDGLKASQIKIRAGTSTRGSGGQTKSVAKIHQNPKFNINTMDGDISILALSSPLTLNSKVAAVKLPSDNQDWAAGTSVLVSGWGTTSEGGSSPSRLQGVTLQVVSKSTCEKAYSGETISKTMLCAGVNGGGKDACQGDSGGPLVVNGVLAGIVSWGYGCARAGYPGIYSHVGVLRSYIKQVTGL